MSKNILIVDDEPGIRKSLKGILEDEGFEVETAASGEECLKLLADRFCSCILLDVWLPGMDGLAIVRRIIAEHGGAIDVADNAPSGTVFTIELPC